jgi:cytochrome c
MTGPSLAGVLGRKAASLQSFHRYSDALKRSGIVWNTETLDAWLSNPAALVPGNDMRFPGMPSVLARQNLIAYLAQSNGHPMSSQSGMNMGGRLPDLKDATPEALVKTIRYCDDTYTVGTSAGTTLKFWEFNLRFKTDSSSQGPRKGVPVLVGQGMQGDRAQVVFADPAEIGGFIKSQCP